MSRLCALYLALLRPLCSLTRAHAGGDEVVAQALPPAPTLYVTPNSFRLHVYYPPTLLAPSPGRARAVMMEGPHRLCLTLKP